MKTTPLHSFLKFYVMRSPRIDLYDIAHVKVDFIPLQKMYVIPILGRFVQCFVQCGSFYPLVYEKLDACPNVEEILTQLYFLTAASINPKKIREIIIVNTFCDISFRKNHRDICICCLAQYKRHHFHNEQYRFYLDNQAH